MAWKTGKENNPEPAIAGLWQFVQPVCSSSGWLRISEENDPSTAWQSLTMSSWASAHKAASSVFQVPLLWRAASEKELLWKGTGISGLFTHTRLCTLDKRIQKDGSGGWLQSLQNCILDIMLFESLFQCSKLFLREPSPEASASTSPQKVTMAQLSGLCKLLVP